MYQLKVSEAISQGFKLLYISDDIYALLSHEILDVALGAYRGPQDFNALYREHLWSKIIRNILKVRVGPKKMLGPFVQMTSRNRALCQELSLAHVKVQVAVFLEFRLACAEKFQSLRNSPNCGFIVSVSQASKFREHLEEEAPEVKGDMTKYHEFWAVTLKTPRFELKVIRGPIIGIIAQDRFTCAC